MYWKASTNENKIKITSFQVILEIKHNYKIILRVISLKIKSKLNQIQNLFWKWFQTVNNILNKLSKIKETRIQKNKLKYQSKQLKEKKIMYLWNQTAKTKKFRIQTCMMNLPSLKVVNRKMCKACAAYKIKVMKIRKMSRMRWILIRKIMLIKGGVLYSLARNRAGNIKILI